MLPVGEESGGQQERGADWDDSAKTEWGTGYNHARHILFIVRCCSQEFSSSENFVWKWLELECIQVIPGRSGISQVFLYCQSPWRADTITCLNSAGSSFSPSLSPCMTRCAALLKQLSLWQILVHFLGTRFTAERWIYTAMFTKRKCRSFFLFFAGNLLLITLHSCSCPWGAVLIQGNTMYFAPHPGEQHVHQLSLHLCTQSASTFSFRAAHKFFKLLLPALHA